MPEVKVERELILISRRDDPIQPRPIEFARRGMRHVPASGIADAEAADLGQQLVVDVEKFVMADQLHLVLTVEFAILEALKVGIFEKRPQFERLVTHEMSL